VLTWRDKLGQKYSDLPGVWKLNDFLVVKTNDGEVVMKVREHCFAGPWKNSPLKVVNTDVAGTPPHHLWGDTLSQYLGTEKWLTW